MLLAGEDKGERGRFLPYQIQASQGSILLGFGHWQLTTLFPYRSDAMRFAIYARVSTDDKGQDPENQLRELRAWAINSGHEISGEYVD